MGFTVFTITIEVLEFIPLIDSPYGCDTLRIVFSYTPTTFPRTGTYFLTDEITITISWAEGSDTFSPTDTPEAGGGFGTIDVKQSEHSSIFNAFVQGGSISVTLEYSNAFEQLPAPPSPVTSNTVTYYNVVGIDANNILLRDNLKEITLVDISSRNKSVILPHTMACKGIILHFKIIASTAPNKFTISPYMDQYPDGPRFSSFSSSPVEFTGDIDGVNGPRGFTVLNYVISIVSDGYSWTILNIYDGAVSITPLYSLPLRIISESSETAAVQYSYINESSYTNILLSPMTYSYLKYIFLRNSSDGTITFTLYFPYNIAVENTSSPDTYNTLSVTLPSNRTIKHSFGIILAYLNGSYYIISARILPYNFYQAGGFDPPIITVTNTVNFIQNSSRVYMPLITNSNSSRCNLVILKNNRETNENVIIVSQDSGVFIMNDSFTAISMDFSSVVWFIVNVNRGVSAYIPVCYYSPME